MSLTISVLSAVYFFNFSFCVDYHLGILCFFISTVYMYICGSYILLLMCYIKYQSISQYED